MTSLVISFFHCAELSREGQISVEPVAVEESRSISIKESAQTAYIYMEQVARRLSRWITVTAERFRRTVVRALCRCFRNIVRSTGVQILRRTSVLRI